MRRRLHHWTATRTTEEERRAIRALQRAARIWPQHLWLGSMAGVLNVFRLGEDGKPVMTSSGGVCPSASIATIGGIPNDGGDW